SSQPIWVIVEVRTGRWGVTAPLRHGSGNRIEEGLASVGIASRRSDHVPEPGLVGEPEVLVSVYWTVEHRVRREPDGTCITIAALYAVMASEQRVAGERHTADGELILALQDDVAAIGSQYPFGHEHEGNRVILRGGSSFAGD